MKMTLPHPTHSHVLSPSDFFLFPRLRNELRARKYAIDKDVSDAVELLPNGGDNN